MKKTLLETRESSEADGLARVVTRTERLERGEPLDAVSPRAAEPCSRYCRRADTANFSHHFHLGAAYVASAREEVGSRCRKETTDEEDKIEAARN